MATKVKEPKKVANKPIEAKVNKVIVSDAKIDFAQLPLYVTVIGTGKGSMVQDKEYPNTHRNIAKMLIEKGSATLKTNN